MTVKKAIQKIEVAPKEASWLLCNRGGGKEIKKWHIISPQ